jgi:hypothetical protein
MRGEACYLDGCGPRKFLQNLGDRGGQVITKTKRTYKSRTRTKRSVSLLAGSSSEKGTTNPTVLDVGAQIY